MDRLSEHKAAPSDMPATVETELVAALEAGDEEAAEVLVRTHGHWMLAVARRITGNSMWAEDCVQEAFTSAFRRIDTLKKHSRLKPWLYRIVLNQALMKLRSRRKRNEVPIDELLPVFDENGLRIAEPKPAAPDEIYEREDRCNQIRAKINELPECYRVVLHLRDIEELTTREVAEGLGISETNAKVWLHRARSALKKLLRPVLKADEDQWRRL